MYHPPRTPALGPTAPELDTAPLGNLFLGAHPKSAFSMAIPPVLSLLKQHDLHSVVLFGIEVRAHVFSGMGNPSRAFPDDPAGGPPCAHL